MLPAPVLDPGNALSTRAASAQRRQADAGRRLGRATERQRQAVERSSEAKQRVAKLAAAEQALAAVLFGLCAALIGLALQLGGAHERRAHTAEGVLRRASGSSTRLCAATNRHFRNDVLTAARSDCLV